MDPAPLLVSRLARPVRPVRPRVARQVLPSPPPQTEALIHQASGAIGPARPLMIHCPFNCDGRAKRMGDGHYYCAPSRGGCGSRFQATGFEFDARLPRPSPGRWALFGWDPATGQYGVWVYEAV